MNIFEKIFDLIKALIFMPINISKISQRSENLLRIEEKLASISNQLDNFKPTTQYLIDSLKYDTKDVEIKNDLSNFVSTIDQKFEIHFLQIESLLSIYNSLYNLKLLPATRGWAGSPDFLAKIMSIILKEKPQFVLEASSGVSSIIIGLAIKLNNRGKAISLEHESLYLKFTQEYCEINQINDISNVQYCPLRDYDIFGQIWKWYDIDHLNFTEKIDILIIDGPPRTTQFLARYPDVPLLYKYFSQKTLILLDDANRNDEIIIVQKWIKFLENRDFKVTVTQFNNFEKGMIILEVCRL